MYTGIARLRKLKLSVGKIKTFLAVLSLYSGLLVLIKKTLSVIEQFPNVVVSFHVDHCKQLSDWPGLIFSKVVI